MKSILLTLCLLFSINAFAAEENRLIKAIKIYFAEQTEFCDEYRAVKLAEIKNLLEEGEDPNQIYLGEDSFYGESALGCCIYNNAPGLARLLLEHGANPNYIISRESSPLLRLAVNLRSPDLVRLLLEYGADINQAEIKKIFSCLFYLTRSLDDSEHISFINSDLFLRQLIARQITKLLLLYIDRIIPEETLVTNSGASQISLMSRVTYCLGQHPSIFLNNFFQNYRQGQAFKKQVFIRLALNELYIPTEIMDIISSFTYVPEGFNLINFARFLDQERAEIRQDELARQGQSRDIIPWIFFVIYFISF